ncbi:hypothetical protein NLJ89_g7126 [Agrocybe chaxingu]|uniref:3'-5' exonuclease n=1 Tax=Agrocybe chaxingu TaxID=84603 RepID=A0A9W8JXW8_9AGAR|nr:hypothetical protein NLJ89_g7126 [Agrocybe chaxingu]
MSSKSNHTKKETRGPGRPKGSKDRPRKPGDKKRGRPKKVQLQSDDAETSNYGETSGMAPVHSYEEPEEADDEYDFGDEDLTPEVLLQLSEIEEQAWVAYQSTDISHQGTAGSCSRSPVDNSNGAGANIEQENVRTSLRQLKESASASQTRPFFTIHEPFEDASDVESDDESDEAYLSSDEEILPRGGTRAGTGNTELGDVLNGGVWFKQPKYMSTWLYNYFKDTIGPLLFERNGRNLVKPVIYSETRSCGTPPSFWVYPPEPAILLARHRFDPTLYYSPRVFVWLPHFFVKLRVSNQHKMGPNGVHALLVEMHTLRFSTLQAQYLESAFEVVSGFCGETNGNQTTLHTYLDTTTIPSFGDFGSNDQYSGFVPSERYLSEMMNKAIEADENDANQHTACLPPDQLAIDDSHKVNKHIAKVDNVPVFGALWTCMDARYIRAQALTLTKAHEERVGPLHGIATSIKLYGYKNPRIAFSDDPVKDKALLYRAFPSLAKNLTPMATAYGLKPLKTPSDMQTHILSTSALVESVFSSLLAPLDLDESAHLCASVDAEWNVSRRVGVSIIQVHPHVTSNTVYIIPLHKFAQLPSSLLRFFLSDRVFKIGSSIKGDLTRIKKQFPQLEQKTLTFIDLKEHCIRRGITKREESGSLERLLEKTVKLFISKNECFRKCDDWERNHLHPDLLEYAVLDVYASRLIFEETLRIIPISQVEFQTAPGTAVTLLAQEGGNPIAYGQIADPQPVSWGGILVKTASQNRLLIEVTNIIAPSAVAILHHAPGRRSSRTNVGALTLAQLRDAAPQSSHTMVVSLVSHLRLGHPEIKSCEDEPTSPSDSPRPSIHGELTEPDGTSDSDEETGGLEMTEQELQDTVSLEMLEAYAQSEEKRNGKRRRDDTDYRHSRDQADVPALQKLCVVVDSPPDLQEEYTRIKKDVFHAFHMLPIPIHHGARPAFLHALRDHIMRWDPTSRDLVDKACQKHFNLTFDQMLIKNPRFIAERTPQHIPSPSILVLAIQHVYDMFRDATDVKTGAALFTRKLCEKAEAVLDLARQGYLSDLVDVPLYERAGTDKYGLQKWKCVRGTNKVEGGPHGDIYRKFGALHAGPRLSTNCLTDHRTWYNLQAYAKHLFGVKWEYHHNLGLINRVSFLLNYLSDIVPGARSYSDWVNGDLYERTKEEFGICTLPESLRIRLGMESYSQDAAEAYPLNRSDDWLRKRQGLALPALPPTTPEARKYFFTQIRKFAEDASANGKRKVDFEAFAKEWNQSADGKDRFYVTEEVLSSYAKSWEKATNIRASEEAISDQIHEARESGRIFAAAQKPFPSYLTPSAVLQEQPSRGILEALDPALCVPPSLSTVPALSRPLPPSVPQMMLPFPMPTTTGGIPTPRSSSTPTPPAVPSIQNVWEAPLSFPSYVIPNLAGHAFGMDSFAAAPDEAKEPKRRRVAPGERALNYRLYSIRDDAQKTMSSKSNHTKKETRGPGRPKGSKDRPRKPGDKKRGRPKKVQLQSDDAETSNYGETSGMAPVHSYEEPEEADDEYDFGDEDLTPEVLLQLSEIEEQAWVAYQSTDISHQGTAGSCSRSPVDNSNGAGANIEQENVRTSLRQLKESASASQTRPFFTIHEPFEDASDVESDDESDEAYLSSDEEILPRGGTRAGTGNTELGDVLNGGVWFKQPKYMSTWLYNYFKDTIGPLLFERNGRNLVKPVIYSETRSCGTPPSFWVYPPEPAILLARHRFDPTLYYSPRVFVWLPHFFVKLRVSNQHKMGPNGVHALLVEMHTLRFSTLQAQYLESAFEVVSGFCGETNGNQTTLHTYLDTTTIPSFGDFGSNDQYSGFVPSERYLSEMMNKAIEADENDANQHTACLPPDQLAIDDSHKVNKHIAKVDNVPVFGALWTCMDARYIRAQALTLTKAHEERVGPLHGIATSIKLYGYKNPRIAFSDDPVKDKALLYRAFPSLAKNLTPMATAYGLKPLKTPSDMQTHILSTSALVESVFSSLLAPLDLDESAHLCASVDAEWNVSRRVGVSIIQVHPHVTSNTVYIIPLHKFAQLPSSLLRFFLSDRVFKIGSSIKGDLTRIKKQFPQLEQKTLTFIDLKEHCIRRGITKREESGSLERLLEKTVKLFISKNECFRKCDDWERNHLHPDLLEYAVLDVYASRLIFEETLRIIPISQVEFQTAPGTAVTLLAQEGGNPIAYGQIADPQPVSWGGILVKTASQNRLLIEVTNIIAPSAVAILHHAPGRRSSRTNVGALTLAQLRDAAPQSSHTMVVSLVSHLRLGHPEIKSCEDEPTSPSDSPRPSIHGELTEPDGTSDSDEETGGLEMTEQELQDTVSLEMLEAYAQSEEKRNGKRRRDDTDYRHSRDQADVPALQKLCVVVDSPPDLQEEYTRIKKDVFHAFHMLPIPIHHGARPAFLHALRDHIMRWDPTSRDLVDKACQKHFNLTFDQMLIKNPRFIAERTPQHIPSPSILVLAIQHVYDMFRDATDVKTGAALFTRKLCEKAEAVLDLARQGYLSDLVDVPLYERAGTDKYGLQKWKCVRGTNKVEGGPHGDIYRKFGALHAGPRLSTNCLTDHRTWYNLQAYAKHLFGVKWEYHHNLGLINRVSFLLNYLSDIVPGARSYSDWVNGDLYERTKEEFGICTLPESLRIRLGMESYSQDAAEAYPLNRSDDWLRKRQGLALPALPPTTPEARKYFFTQIRKFAEDASANGKRKVDFEAFAKEWNQSADGKDRFYVTEEVLSSYAKSWEKATNIRASEEAISDQIHEARESGRIFAAAQKPFPSYLTPSAVLQEQPSRGILEALDPALCVPPSLSTVPALSRPLPPSVPQMMLPFPMPTTTGGIPTPRSSSTPTPPAVPSIQNVMLSGWILLLQHQTRQKSRSDAAWYLIPSADVARGRAAVVAVLNVLEIATF